MALDVAGEVDEATGASGDGDDVAFVEGDIGGQATAVEDFLDINDFDDAFIGGDAHDFDVGEVGFFGGAAGAEDDIDEGWGDIGGDFPRAWAIEFAGEIDEGAVFDIGALDAFDENGGGIELGALEGAFDGGFDGGDGFASDGDAPDLGHDDVATAADLVAAIEGRVFADKDFDGFAWEQDFVGGGGGVLLALGGFIQGFFDLAELGFGGVEAGLPVSGFLVEAIGGFEIAGGGLHGELFLDIVQFRLGVADFAFEGLFFFGKIFDLAGGFFGLGDFEEAGGFTGCEGNRAGFEGDFFGGPSGWRGEKDGQKGGGAEGIESEMGRKFHFKKRIFSQFIVEQEWCNRKFIKSFNYSLGWLIKIFCEAEVEKIFGVVAEQVIGGALLVLGEELDLEGVGEEVIDLGDGGPSVVVTEIGIGKGGEACESEAGARASSDLDIGTCAVLDAGKSIVDEIDDFIARKEAIEDDFGTDDLADIVADDFVGLILENADETTEIEAFLGIGAGLVGEDEAPEEGVFAFEKERAGFGVELELVGDGAVDAEANGLAEADLEVGTECGINEERFKAKIFAFGIENDAELISKGRKATVALIVPEIGVSGDEAKASISEDFAIGLGADGVAVEEDF